LEECPQLLRNRLLQRQDGNLKIRVVGRSDGRRVGLIDYGLAIADLDSDLSVVMGRLEGDLIEVEAVLGVGGGHARVDA